jgi:hypothetical protein
VHKPVLTKADFVSRYIAGEFGNHSPTWGTLDEFLQAKYTPGRSNKLGQCHIRNRIAGGATYYNIPCIEVEHRWKRLVKHGVDPTSLYISLMAPTEETIFQGEVMRGLWGLELTYTTVALPMRDALLKDTRLARGIIASSLVKHFLCDNSYEWLQSLLDNYPDHVVEFSTYGVNWGTLPSYNTVFWEVRLY